MLFFLTDPLESTYGPLRPPLLIARELVKRYSIKIVSPMVSPHVLNKLKDRGIEVVSLNKRFLASGSFLTLEAWLRRSRFKLELDGCVIVNFSQCFLTNAHVYYAQGPVTKAFDDLSLELKWPTSLIYKFARAFLIRCDKNFNHELRKTHKLFIANSKFCACMYEDWRIKVDDVIYPPMDCERFKPTTSKPSEDYVFTYVGKETKRSVLKRIADAGVKIKAFGSKIPHFLKSLKHANIELLGRVSDEQLVDLYSNALYTLFAFTHEPFGYVPIESMSCGTPVLTYNKQGPKESVINGVTGWLVNSDEELVELAIKLWREGCPSWMRAKCRERALDFDLKVIANKWLQVLKGSEVF